MKLSTALHLVQLTVICFLLYQVFDMNRQLQALATVSPSRDDQSSSHANTQKPPSTTDANNARQLPQGMSNEQLLSILRSDLATLNASVLQRPALEEPNEVAESETTPEQSELLARVHQELDFFISEGEISDQDMYTLETEIAKLSKNDQKQVLQKLVRALNSGDMEGRL